MNIIRLEEVDSTNLYAKKNLINLPDKSIILADRQTSGRGRFDRSWIDLGNDNIFMSIILKPSDNFMHCYPNLTQYLSLVLCQTIEEYGLAPKIKWPNDVLIDGKKIAGILSETVMHGNTFNGLVLGVGINLNSDNESLTLIKDKEATALNLEISVDKIDKEEFLNNLLDKFFDNYDKFLANGFAEIKDEYLSRACFMNSSVSVQVFNKKQSGIAKAITDSGELVIEKDNKEIVLTMGDIL